MFLYQRQKLAGLSTSELLVQARHFVDGERVYLREGGFADPAIHLDYDYARTHASFGSHTDVVIGIQNGVAVTLGGNVSDSVSTKEFALAADGKIVPGHGLFALMKNMT